VAGSLRDQLVNAGLATKEQARKAEKQNRAEAQAQRRGDKKKGRGKQGEGENTGSTQGGAAAANRSANAKRVAQHRSASAKKVARDKQLAEERNARAQAKALRAEIKQIIEQNDQRAKSRTDEDVSYQFVHGKKIKRIYVPAAQREQLIKGTLVVVNNDGLYHFVAQDVAAKIESRDPKRIIVAHGSNKDANRDASKNAPSGGPGVEGQEAKLSADDEYYAQFEVPDDLDW